MTPTPPAPVNIPPPAGADRIPGSDVTASAPNPVATAVAAAQEVTRRWEACLAAGLEIAKSAADRFERDPGAPFEGKAVRAFSMLREWRSAEWARLRAALKVKGVPLRELEALMKRSDGQMQRQAERGAAPAAPDPRLRIVVHLGRVPAVIDEAEGALRNSSPAVLYQKGGLLVRVLRDGFPRIEAVPQAHLLELMAKTGRWLHRNRPPTPYLLTTSLAS